MPFEICRHVKANGLRCQSPALTDEHWCYFHYRLITRHRYLNEIRTERPVLQIPALEDRESIQVALSLVSGAVLNGTLSEKRAAILLRALSIASRNALNLDTEPCDSDIVVRSTMPTLDGFHLDERRMSDSSQPPARPPRRGSFQPDSVAPPKTPARRSIA